MTTLEFLRKQHHKAIVAGWTATAAKIREDIRKEAKRQLDSGKTLSDIY